MSILDDLRKSQQRARELNRRAPRQPKSYSPREVIFIGHDFYHRSHTRMGPMYEILTDGSWERFMEADILQSVTNGGEITVHYRPATREELRQAEYMLRSLE